MCLQRQGKKDDELKLYRTKAIRDEFHPWFQSLPSNASPNSDIAPEAAVEDSETESESSDN